jgi:hypothetical protein
MASRTLHLVSMSLLVATLWATSARSAHAGFGRRGSSNNDNKQSSGRSHSDRTVVDLSHSSAPAASSSSSPGGTRRRASDDGPGRREYRRPRAWRYGLIWQPLPPPVLLTPVPTNDGYVEPAPVVQPDESSGTTTLSIDFLLDPRRGNVFGAQVSFEGERFGLVLNYSAAFLPIAGTTDHDTLHMGQARVTYALLALEGARLRAEAGLHLAAAPEVTFFAPGLGVSAAVHLVGPLGWEARVYGNAWPYTQLDMRTGLTLSDQSFGMSLGMRALYLNDNGVLGAVNADDTDDFMFGPSVLIAVAM